jgi:hypothetical protein
MNFLAEAFPDDVGIILEAAECTTDVIRFCKVCGILSAIHRINRYHASKKNVHLRIPTDALPA